jgi:hypothetical protein
MFRPSAAVNRSYLDMASRLGRRDPESAAEMFEKILGPVENLKVESLNGIVEASPGPLDPSMLDAAGGRVVALDARSVDTAEKMDRVVKDLSRGRVVFASDDAGVVGRVAAALNGRPGAEARLSQGRLFFEGSLRLAALNGVLPPGAGPVELIAPKGYDRADRSGADERLRRAEIKPLESLLRLIEYFEILNAFILRQA